MTGVSKVAHQNILVYTHCLQTVIAPKQSTHAAVVVVVVVVWNEMVSNGCKLMTWRRNLQNFKPASGLKCFST